MSPSPPFVSLEASGDASSRSSATRTCSWCHGPIRAAARCDSKYCGQRCRQAAHRFHCPSRLAGATLRVSPGQALRFGYADPPYPGLAARYYGTPEVDHEQLIGRLVAEFPAGWALSTSAAALPSLLTSCPTGVRVGAWFRGERPTASYSPLTAWEPVIYFGGRRYLSLVDARRVDALVHVARARLTDPARLVGAKPAAFCAWLFQLLGMMPGDDLVDLFPGSGGIGRSWEAYCSAARDASLLDPATPAGATGRAHQVDASCGSARRELVDVS